MSILTLGSKKEEKGNFQSKKREGKFPIKGKKEARKFPIKEREKEKRKERKFPTKEWEKVKKKEAPGQRNQKKCAERSLDQTISEQYRIVTK